MGALHPHAGPLAVLVNPTSGGGRGRRYAEPVARRLTDRGFEVQVLVGGDGAEAAALAREHVAARVQALVVVGGDGMVHIGANATACSGVPLGIVPAGTGNDFARLLGLPMHDPEGAVDVVLTEDTHELDAGQVEDTWFAGVLSAGFDSMVNERANRMRWPRGRARYNLSILAELSVFHPVRFRLSLDGEVVEHEAMLVAVGNGVSYGGGMRVCPGARVDDGTFQVTVLERVSKVEFLRVFPKVYSGSHVDHPRVRVYQARDVMLDATGVVAYADGERLGALPMRARAVPGALTVLCPPLT